MESMGFLVQFVQFMAGLLFSTLLTLGVIPVLYSLLYRVRI